MIRTQISLTEEQMRRLRREAQRRGVSLAALVREAIDSQVPSESDARLAALARLREVAGRYDSGAPDVAERHDEHLSSIDRW